MRREQKKTPLLKHNPITSIFKAVSELKKTITAPAKKHALRAEMERAEDYQLYNQSDFTMTDKQKTTQENWLLHLTDLIKRVNIDAETTTQKHKNEIENTHSRTQKQDIENRLTSELAQFVEFHSKIASKEHLPAELAAECVGAICWALQNTSFPRRNGIKALANIATTAHINDIARKQATHELVLISENKEKFGRTAEAALKIIQDLGDERINVIAEELKTKTQRGTQTSTHEENNRQRHIA